MKTIERVVSLGLAVALVTACSGPSDDTSTETVAVTGDNGLVLNSLSTNGLFSNGVWTNGVWTNSLWSNGVWTNGVWTNGVWTNGVWTNGVWTNGVWTNGVWTNGVWTNGIWDDAVWTSNPTAQEILQTNPYTRQVLQYLYECAMPVGVSTTLDPGDGTTIELAGKIGIGINADNTGWWESGLCDETCQRWTSACLLARTNAYGVKVQISMRAPANAPERIRAALAVTDDESTTYTHREGTFYGNLFATTPPPEGTDGAIVSTPSFYACAGPDSNIPDLTKRFCSSQGYNGPITVVGTCDPQACAGIDPANGAMHDCYTTAQLPRSERQHYSEVITVYLRDPIEVCGNFVCEQNERLGGTCQSDCPEGWAASFDAYIGSRSTLADQLSYDPWFVTDVTVTSGDGVILGGNTHSDVDLGGGSIPARCQTPDILEGAPLGGPELCDGVDNDSDSYVDESVDSNLVLARYTRDGAHLWSERIGATRDMVLAGIAPGPDNALVVVGDTYFGNERQLYVAKIDETTGDMLWSRFVAAGAHASDAVAVDPADGSIVLAIETAGTWSVPALGLSAPSVPRDDGFGPSSDVVVMKLAANGLPLWAVTYGDGGRDSPTDLTIDAHGDPIVASMHDTFPFGLAKLAGSDGTTLWTKAGTHASVVVDANDNVYATGHYSMLEPPYSFAYPTSRGSGFFVVKYPATGATPITVGAPLQSTRVDGLDIAFNGAGNLVVSSSGGGAAFGADDAIDFGSGSFRTYGTPDVFVTSYDWDDLAFLWAKHIPMAVGGVYRGMALDSRDRMVLAGGYSGSTLVGGSLLVSTVPEDDAVGNTFLASVVSPPAIDQTPPVIANVPQSFVVEALGPQGAPAWYTLPTATDSGNAGVDVTCTKPPVPPEQVARTSLWFPLGTSTVVCRAADPRGNESSASFAITVVDRAGPVFVSQPPTLIAAAADASGADVPFALPIAVDQVDGVRDVSCIRASGSHFAIGTTAVTCSAMDASGNGSEISFSVHVVSSSAPTLVVPQSVDVTATSSAGAIVRYNVYAIDAEDGIVEPSCAPASGAVFPLGTTTVTCTATDQSGQSAQRSFPVTVSANWSGILQPINPDGSSTFKLKSTVPVKFKLTGASAGITNLVATLGLVKVSSTTSGTVVEATSTSAADTGNTFRYDATADQYVFNLSTKSLSVGTWELRIDLGDGVARSVRISLRN